MTKVRTNFLIETHEISIVKRRKMFFRDFCEYCQREVSMFPLEEAAFLVCQNTEEIYSLMNERKIHFRYLSGEKPYICLTSLCLV
ncbi:MAG: hypothetical protein AAB336_01425 [Acidobacteriota bacterium]